MSNLKDIILASVPSDSTIDHDTVLRRYTQVFCILVYMGRARYIKHFTRNSLSDAALPFDTADPPADLPPAAADPEFWPCFCKEQWRFCAPILEATLSDKHFERDQILPVIFKEKLLGGASATLWQIKLPLSHYKMGSDDFNFVRSPRFYRP
jgi:hypothetical protein